jgi:glycosyltransferase involved in cell wall biosynthesis
MASIIIPAYNEEKHIENVLRNIPDGHHVIIVDDGSTDNTCKIAEAYGHKTITLEKNYGKGLACLEGIKQSKHNICIFIDGDGQLNPKEITKFIEALKESEIVIGQRDMKKIPWSRKLSNIFAKWCVNYLTNKNFSDVLCGFRGVKRNKFLELELRKMDYFFECEMLIEAVKKGVKISSVPVDVNYSIGSRMPVKKSMDVAFWLIKNVIKKSIGRP